MSFNLSPDDVAAVLRALESVFSTMPFQGRVGQTVVNQYNQCARFLISVDAERPYFVSVHIINGNAPDPGFADAAVVLKELKERFTIPGEPEAHTDARILFLLLAMVNLHVLNLQSGSVNNKYGASLSDFQLDTPFQSVKAQAERVRAERAEEARLAKEYEQHMRMKQANNALMAAQASGDTPFTTMQMSLLAGAPAPAQAAEGGGDDDLDGLLDNELNELLLGDEMGEMDDGQGAGEGYTVDEPDDDAGDAAAAGTRGTGVDYSITKAQ